MVIFAAQQISALVLKPRGSDFQTPLLGCKRQQKRWHIPAEPGPGSGRANGACQAVSPHAGDDPLRDGWISRKETDGARFGAFRPRARGQVVRVARLVFMGSIEIRETPVWNTTIL